MARRKLEQRNIRSLNKISNGESYSITLPIEAVRAFRWQRRQKVELIIDETNKRIIIQDWNA